MQLGIFVGGSSSRMGQPKGFLRYEGELLLDRALRLAESLRLEPVLVGNDAPYADWSPQVRRCADEGSGPLGGLLGLLRHGPALAIACDMPFLTASHLEILLRAPEASIVLSAGEFFEPFPSRSHPSLCPAIEKQLAEGKSSFQALLRSLPAHQRALVELPTEATRDWDSPEDIEFHPGTGFK